MHPRLAYLAMEIARVMNRTFLSATIIACLLRNNFEIHFWRKVLVFLRGSIHKHVFRFGEHPFNLVDKNRIVHHRRMVVHSEYFAVYCLLECSSAVEVPKMRIQDLMYGTVKCSGKFDMLLWKSQLPSYYSYIYCGRFKSKSLWQSRGSAL
jgi:hypothetical protein